MTQRALRKGDPLPPVNAELMRIYSMRFCPYAQRTRLVLSHKGIRHETVNINIADKPDWFLEKNPLSQIPILEHKGHVVYDSRVCNDFLDGTYPDVGGGRLTSHSPIQRSRDEMLMCYFDSKVIPFSYQLFDPEKTHRARGSLRAGLGVMENRLGDKQFYGGDRPSMVDYHIFPWFERFPAMRHIGEYIGGDFDPLPPESYPRLTAWTQRIRALPQVKAVLTNEEFLKDFFIQGYVKKMPGAYDIGLTAV